MVSSGLRPIDATCAVPPRRCVEQGTIRFPAKTSRVHVASDNRQTIGDAVHQAKRMPPCPIPACDTLLGPVRVGPKVSAGINVRTLNRDGPYAGQLQIVHRTLQGLPSCAIPSRNSILERDASSGREAAPDIDVSLFIRGDSRNNLAIVLYGRGGNALSERIPIRAVPARDITCNNASRGTEPTAGIDVSSRCGDGRHPAA